MTEHLDMTVLSAFLDNELESDDYDRAKRHLNDCPSCSATLAELRAISQGLQAIACAPPPAELSAKLDRLFDRHPTAPGWRRWLPRSLSAAASITLGLLIGNALPGQPEVKPADHNLLAVLGSAPPGALCAQPTLCFLKVNSQ